ncbi:hypothetical protein B5E52_16880 [Bacteroides xylanisolvens]|jgi:hypothetical protein|uniref:Uncharacterized protein n=1 Tax=Bacteroides xylanisolvens TaxID=371601 RepID=A0A1Y4V3G0_9BACE|nr:hypothetical protein B5E52_16880 [Bacteroides xylanisolvens]DAI83732.1 MAG TPA: hypothetical protein [Caudoviricetes sp.]
MGSDLKRRRKIVYKREVRCVVKTKGERLGWEPLDNEKEVPLRTIVGEGNIVSTSCCFISISRKVIL